jgi:transcriptional regulator GlxA family with amidase domain
LYRRPGYPARAVRRKERYVLAEAGILDGRCATTHWAHARALQKRIPLVKMDEDRIFIVDGPVWTSAGMSAGIDLALSMVENDLG